MLNGWPAAKITMNIRADQKTGVAKPRRLRTVTPCEAGLSGRRAVNTPMATPTITAKNSDVPASSTVAKRRSRIKSRTGRSK